MESSERGARQDLARLGLGFAEGGGDAATPVRTRVCGGLLGAGAFAEGRQGREGRFTAQFDATAFTF